MTIQIDVANQKMRMTSNNKEIIAGTQQFVKFQFNLSNDWSGLTVFAQFIQNGTAYNKYLDTNCCCYLPTEIVSGNCNMLLYGTGSSTIATSNYLELKIVNNGYIGNASSTQISQSLYQQLVNMVSGNIKTAIDSTVVSGTKYYLGQQSALSINLPSTANIGDEILICFSSGSTACTLTCSLSGFSFTPKANKTNILTFRCVNNTPGSMVWITLVQES